MLGDRRQPVEGVPEGVDEEPDLHPGDRRDGDVLVARMPVDDDENEGDEKDKE